MFISFIVPAFNVADYLQRCIDSVYSQNIGDSFEVIIINDGSTDNTRQIAEELINSGRYQNLKVINQSNMGSSVARNTGISQASGDYIWCIDSDDWIQKNSLSKIFEYFHNYNPDIFFINLLKIYPDGIEKIEANQFLPKGIIITGAEAIIANYQPASACSAIIKRSFIQSNDLAFFPQLYHQDVEFMYRAVALAKEVIFSDFVPYVYEVHPNSTTTSLNQNKIIKRLTDDAIIADSFKNFSKTLSNTLLRKRIENQAKFIAIGSIYSLLINPNHQNSTIRNHVVHKFRELGLFPLKFPSIGIKRMFLTFFLNVRFFFTGRTNHF